MIYVPKPKEGACELPSLPQDVILLSYSGFEAKIVVVHQVLGTTKAVGFLIVNYEETCEEQETHVRQIFSNRPGGVG